MLKVNIYWKSRTISFFRKMVDNFFCCDVLL